MIMMITIQDPDINNYDQVRLAFRTLDKGGIFMIKIKIMEKIMIMMITIQDHDIDNHDQVRLAFRTLDKDGSGTIETSEFKHLMTHIGLEMKR